MAVGNWYWRLRRRTRTRRPRVRGHRWLLLVSCYGSLTLPVLEPAILWSCSSTFLHEASRQTRTLGYFLQCFFQGIHLSRLNCRVFNPTMTPFHVSSCSSVVREATETSGHGFESSSKNIREGKKRSKLGFLQVLAPFASFSLFSAAAASNLVCRPRRRRRKLPDLPDIEAAFRCIIVIEIRTWGLKFDLYGGSGALVLHAPRRCRLEACDSGQNR